MQNAGSLRGCRESSILKTTIFKNIVVVLLCKNKVNKLRVKAMYFRRM